MKLTMKKTVYPSKTTLNLAVKERSSFAPYKLIPLLALLVAAAVLFGKFAVADRLTRVDRARAELSALQQKAAALETAVADFDELQEQYSRYSVGWMTDEELENLPRTEMLDLVEAELMPVSQVRRFSASGNILSVELGGVTLEDTSRIVQRLYERQDVTNVSVYTASSKTETSAQAVVSMVIAMTLPQEGGEGK